MTIDLKVYCDGCNRPQGKMMGFIVKVVIKNLKSVLKN